MIKRVKIEDFLTIHRNENIPIIDVRSPIEYNAGHIPSAYNVYLFNDDERANVGTTYKKEGRESAILLGLDYVGRRMSDILRQVDEISKKHNNTKKVLIHCFRGGDRSGSISWLLSIYKYDVYVLDGGYKSYRKYVLGLFEKNYKINIVTGRTGSSKTFILQKMKELNIKNNKVINLENLANHKGSAFGWINEDKQPTQEQFENNLALELESIDNINDKLWLEDESLLIGKIAIPKALFNNMKNPENIIYIEKSIEDRANHITDTYGKYNKDDLKESILKIKKRLGDERTRLAIKLLEENRIYDSVLEILYYYDKAYKLSVDNNKIIKLECTNKNTETIVDMILSIF